jgi:hypothetical protein
LTSIVTPSGETQLPWVAGGFALAVVVDELGAGDGDGLGLGDGDGDGDGDEVGVGVGDGLDDEDDVGDGDALGLGDGIGLVVDADVEDFGVGLQVLHSLPASAGWASTTVAVRVARTAAQEMATRRADRVIAGDAFRVADESPRRARRP